MVKILNFFARVISKQKSSISENSFDIREFSLARYKKIFYAAFLIVAINFLIFYFSFYSLKVNFAIFDIAKSFIVYQMSSLFSPSGGGIGFVELFTGGYLSLKGMMLGQSASVIVLFRLFNFWIPVFFGLYFLSHKGIRLLKRIPNS